MLCFEEREALPQQARYSVALHGQGMLMRQRLILLINTKITEIPKLSDANGMRDMNVLCSDEFWPQIVSGS